MSPPSVDDSVKSCLRALDVLIEAGLVAESAVGSVVEPPNARFEVKRASLEATLRSVFSLARVLRLDLSGNLGAERDVDEFGSQPETYRIAGAEPEELLPSIERASAPGRRTADSPDGPERKLSEKQATALLQAISVGMESFLLLVAEILRSGDLSAERLAEVESWLEQTGGWKKAGLQ